MTRKELFEEGYCQALELPVRERKPFLMQKMRPYFDEEAQAEWYVSENISRKRRNLTGRRTRMYRKANLHTFNYFVTFTYDDRLHTEESFQKTLRTELRHLCHRKQWRYMGVWERSPEKQRLHFHGIFDIPEGAMPGYLVEINDYSFRTRKRQMTHQNVHFLKKYGRNDFEALYDPSELNEAIAYLLKYLEKSGERIVYSKGLPQYFLSDLLEEDVVTTIGLEDAKLLLFDDFSCWDDGVYIGPVQKETIRQLRKSNN